MSPRIEALRMRPPTEHVDRLEQMIETVVDRLDRQEDCTQLIAEINAITDGSFGPQHFLELYARTSSRDFAEVALMQAQAVAADLTRQELIEVLDLIGSPDPVVDTTSFWVGYLKRCFPDSFNSDLVFFPFRDMSAEETADELLLRDSLFREGGIPALRAHIVPQAQEVLANPDSPGWAEEGARSALSEYGDDIQVKR